MQSKCDHFFSYNLKQFEWLAYFEVLKAFGSFNLNRHVLATLKKQIGCNLLKIKLFIFVIYFFLHIYLMDGHLMWSVTASYIIIYKFYGNYSIFKPVLHNWKLCADCTNQSIVSFESNSLFMKEVKAVEKWWKIFVFWYLSNLAESIKFLNYA